MTNEDNAFIQLLEENDCYLLMEETSHEELRDLDKDLPSDTHLVRYRVKSPVLERMVEKGHHPEDLSFVSAIRAYKKADIFDALHDGGMEVLEITSGYGVIKPKLFNG